MTERIFNGRVVDVKSASGVKGILCRRFDGEYFLRVAQEGGDFKDYALRHSDLPITIDADAEAAFYEDGVSLALDHAPNTLGLIASDRKLTHQ